MHNNINKCASSRLAVAPVLPEFARFNRSTDISHGESGKLYQMTAHVLPHNCGFCYPCKIHNKFPFPFGLQLQRSRIARCFLLLPQTSTFNSNSTMRLAATRSQLLWASVLTFSLLQYSVLTWPYCFIEEVGTSPLPQLYRNFSTTVCCTGSSLQLLASALQLLAIQGVLHYKCQNCWVYYLPYKRANRIFYTEFLAKLSHTTRRQREFLWLPVCLWCL